MKEATWFYWDGFHDGGRSAVNNPNESTDNMGDRSSNVTTEYDSQTGCSKYMIAHLWPVEN